MKIQIRDSINKVLSFDLKEILNIFNDEVGRKFKWRIAYLERVGDFSSNHSLIKLVEDLNKIRPGGSVSVSYDTLKILAEKSIQIINIKIIGESFDERIEIKAIDSSFWEIESNNNEIINTFIKAFQKVNILD